MNSWHRLHPAQNETAASILGVVCWGLPTGSGGIWITELRAGLVSRCWRNHTAEEEEKDTGLYFLKILSIEMLSVFLLGSKLVNDHSYQEASNGPNSGLPTDVGLSEYGSAHEVDRDNFSTKLNSSTSINGLVIFRIKCNLERWFLSSAGIRDLGEKLGFLLKRGSPQLCVQLPKVCSWASKPQEPHEPQAKTQ